MIWAVPIYASMIFASYNFGDRDEYYWILPGFRLITYNGSERIIDQSNTTNTIKRYRPTKIDNAEFGRLYYNTGTASTPVWVEIRGVYESEPAPAPLS